MEDNEQKLQDSSSQPPEDNTGRTRVGFPKVKEEKGSKGKIIFVILAILALAGVGAWLLFGQGEGDEAEQEPTPTQFEETSTPTPTQTEIDRSEVSIQILNGSGISGAAGDLQEDIEELGYTEIEVGNASSQDYETTEVIFSSDVEEGVRDEIVEALEDKYEDVDSETGSVENYDIRIVTGYPKGHTPSPTKAIQTATPTPTEAESDDLTPTTTPTP